MASPAPTRIEIGLTAAIVAMEGTAPQILTIGAGNEGTGLPSGPFEPLNHRTFEIALRTFVADQTALNVGYIEQLYTFGDRGRHARVGDTRPRARVSSPGTNFFRGKTGAAGARKFSTTFCLSFCRGRRKQNASKAARS